MPSQQIVVLSTNHFTGETTTAAVTVPDTIDAVHAVVLITAPANTVNIFDLTLNLFVLESVNGAPADWHLRDSNHYSRDVLDTTALSWSIDTRIARVAGKQVRIYANVGQGTVAASVTLTAV